MLRAIAVIALFAAAGCGTSETGSAPEPESVATPAERILDQTHYFRKEGLVEAKVVDDHLAGKDFMPGGNLAEYDRGGKKFQVFFSQRRNADLAMFLFMDYKEVLADQKFVPHFGGYFGMDGETPTFIFPRGRYIVGITGLSLEDADQEGRWIAGYLN